MFAALCCLELACGGEEPEAPRPLTTYFASTWATDLTEVRGCRRSVDHDLRSIRVLVDPQAEVAYTGRAEPFPEGSLVLKAEYDDEDCTEIAGFTVMKKGKAGSRPSLGDWTFQRTGADRRVLSTDDGRCVSCHLDCQAPTGWDWTCADP